MKLLELLPSADLLDKLEGLEDGLKRRRRLGRLGKLGAATTLVVWIGNFAPLIQDLHVKTTPVLGKVLPIGLLVLIVAFFMAILYSLWLKESTSPIRFTCSLGNFAPVEPKEGILVSPVAEKMGWLRHDLAQRLNERVGRLQFFMSSGEKSPAQHGKEGGNEASASGDQHIHIEGVYYTRNLDTTEADSADCELVVMPRVRIGRYDSPEKLAKPVYYPYTESAGLPISDYEKMIEEVYFNVVSEVYKQIRQDVERKIALLPTRRHKAIAYYFEAEDYSRSNTLHAYREAGQLYLEASRAFEPFNPLGTPFPKSRALRIRRNLDQAVDSLAKRLIRSIYRLIPTFARYEIFAARTKLGYANMLHFHSQLSQLLGHRPAPTFEARLFAEQALATLLLLPPDATRNPDDAFGRKRGLFDAHVTNALSWSFLNHYAFARDHLDRAKSIDPHRATTSSVYLYAEGFIQAIPQRKYEFLVRAVEQDATFEVAKFEKAFQREMRWRSDDAPTDAIIEANLVFKEYQEVLRLNPSNIGAAANMAFILWATWKEGDPATEDHLNRAKALLHRALRYNELAPETLVIEHHYGLARIHAETGDFQTAYEHLRRAEDGRRSHHGTHNVDASSYLFAFVGECLRQRYKTYAESVVRNAAALTTGSKDAISRKASNLVCAFALDEYGSSCLSQHFRMAQDESILNAAETAFKASIASDECHVLSHYHHAWIGNAEERETRLEKVIELDSSWLDAKLQLAVVRANRFYDLSADLRQLGEHSREMETLVEKGSDSAPNKIQITPDVVVKGWASPAAEILQATQLGEDPRIKEIEKEVRFILEKHGIEADSNSENPRQELLKLAGALADQLHARIEDLKKVVQAAAGDLLPHHWLWKTPGHTASDFNWQCIDDGYVKDEAKFEREFENLHAIALIEWAKILSLTSGDGLNGAVPKLLTRIRKTFFPADLHILNHCRRHASDIEAESLKTEGDRILAAMLNGPCERTALEALEGMEFGEEILPKLLDKARECGAALRGPFIPLAISTIKKGDGHFENRNVKETKAAYRMAMDLGAGEPYAGSAAGKLAIVLLSEGEVKEADSLIKKSLPAVYHFLPSSLNREDGESEKFLRRNERIRLQLKLGYERHLRKGTNRSATDAVMGLLRIRGTDASRPSEFSQDLSPLVLELDDAFLPADPEDFLIQKALPRLRMRIEDCYGVKIPFGIRCRAITEVTWPGQYRILDHEVLVEEGTATGKAPASMEDPDGTWRDSVWFILERFEKHLESNLSQWVRAQEVQSLLKNHCKHRYDDKNADSIIEVEAHGHIGPLTVLVRSLLSERVSIRPFSRIYEIFRLLLADGVHPQEMECKVRMDPVIKPNLWGNRREYQRYMLSVGTEGELMESCERIDGFTALVLGPGRHGEIVDGIASKLAGKGKRSLTVRNPVLRPLVRRLIAEKMPDVPVLAECELESFVRSIESTEVDIPSINSRAKATA